MNENDCGVMLLMGEPGVGKSALMAALSQIGFDALGSTINSSSLDSLLSRRNWPKVDVISYFIERRVGNTTSGEDFLRTLLADLNERYHLQCFPGDSITEMCQQFRTQLNAVSNVLRESGSKLLLLVDGLDESIGPENATSTVDSVLQCIPPVLPPNVFLVLSSRPRTEINDLCGLLQRYNNVCRLELGGLCENDVRAIIEREVGRDNIQPAYIADVMRVSKGDADYVTSLAELLANGSLSLGDARALPASMPKLRQEILDRLLKTARDAKLSVLLTLSLAGEPLSDAQLGGITGQTNEVQMVIVSCFEVLIESNVPGKAPTYRLYREGFAEYLRDRYEANLPAVSRQILGFAARDAFDRPAESGLLRTVERLYDGKPLTAGDAPAISTLIEKASRMLTGWLLLQQEFLKRSWSELGPLLLALSQCKGAATARLVIDCLIAKAEHHSVEVGRVTMELIERPARGRREPLWDAVQTVLLGACAASDPNVCSLGTVAVFRLVRANETLGMNLLQELANRSLRFGLVRPQTCTVFALCAIGLFFEHAHDTAFVTKLKLMARGLIARVWGLKFALWLFPKVVAFLSTSVPDDYNNINPAELKEYKKYVARHPSLLAAVIEMVDFIDPSNGTSQAFARAVGQLDAKITCPEAMLACLSAQQAVVSRAIAGDLSALDAAYASWKNAPLRGVRQDFMHRLRIVQVGLELTGQSPLGKQWTDRMETAVRQFMHHEHGVHEGACGVYTIGSVVAGVVFLAHQYRDAHLELLRELVDWASAGERGMLRWPEAERNRQADALLVRVLEIAGVERGLFDRLVRETTFFGIQCFLNHAANFDEYLWERVATVLARMNIYHPNEVGQFLAGLSVEYGRSLQVHMNRVLPKEGSGSVVLQPCAEVFSATVFGEEPCKKNGLRARWQDILRNVLGRESFAASFRYGLQRFIQAINTDGSE
jgi:hypothetical protein